ncbi:hypothetical protein JCM5350_001086 [Sporobolomyces pararoseus]
MLLLRSVSLLLAACFASAAVVPAQTLEDRNYHWTGTVNNNLVKRAGCIDGLVPYAQFPGTKLLLCLTPETIVNIHAAEIAAIGAGTVLTLVYGVTSIIQAALSGSESKEAGRRLSRRQLGQADGTAFIEIGGVETEVPFVRAVDGKATISLLDVFYPSSSSLSTRDVSTSEATVVGGSATFHSNGTLDNFTIDFSIPSSSYLSNSTSDTSNLAKRDYWALHTTYWAQPGHSKTSLDHDSLVKLVTASYTKLPRSATEACGYMANSGTWHGAFRHWTGDYGYTIGECERARDYK